VLLQHADALFLVNVVSSSLPDLLLISSRSAPPFAEILNDSWLCFSMQIDAIIDCVRIEA